MKIMLLLILIMLILFAFELGRRIITEKKQLPRFSKDINESLIESGRDIRHGMTIGDGHNVIATHKRIQL